MGDSMHHTATECVGVEGHQLMRGASNTNDDWG